MQESSLEDCVGLEVTCDDLGLLMSQPHLAVVGPGCLCTQHESAAHSVPLLVT